MGNEINDKLGGKCLVWVVKNGSRGKILEEMEEKTVSFTIKETGTNYSKWNIR